MLQADQGHTMTKTRSSARCKQCQTVQSLVHRWKYNTVVREEDWQSRDPALCYISAIGEEGTG